MKNSAIKVICVFSAVAIGVISTLTLTSGWFIWDLLPSDGEIALSVNVKAIEPLISAAKGYEQDNKFLESLEPYLTSAQRIAYAKKGDTEFIVLAPKWFSLRQAKEVLSEKGWQQAQWATLIFATRGQNNSESANKNHLSSIINAFLMPWKQAFLNKQQIRPIGILKAKAGTFPGLTKDISLIGTHKKDEIVIVVSLEPHEKTISKFPQFSSEEREKLKFDVDSNDLLALPAELLANIPTNQKNQIILNALEEIGFKTTASKALPEILKLDSIIIKTKGENIALGTKNHGNIFIKEAQAWVEREESYNYPQKRAFKLPDGTLGNELRPSKPDIAWVNTGENCAYFAGKEKTWWLCGEDKKAILGTSKEITQTSIRAVNDNYFQLQLAQIKQKQPTLPIKSLSGIGTEEKAIFLIRVDN